MRFLSIAVVALAIASPMFAQNSPDSVSPNVPKGFVAPAHIGRYARTDSHDYGTPDMGVAYQYRIDTGPNDSSFATLYLYQREAEERDWPADSVLATAGGVFKQGLEVMRQRGDYNAYQIAFEGRDSVMVDGAWRIPGYHLAYSYRRGPSIFVSFFNLYVAGNALIKVRGTVPAAHFEKTDLISFAHEVVAQAAKGVRNH